MLVPGLIDDPEDVAKTAAFAGELGNVERVDVLPFHQMGQYKWKKLGLEYARKHPAAVERTRRADVCALQERGAEGLLSDTSSRGDCAGPEMTFPSAVKREP